MSLRSMIASDSGAIFVTNEGEGMIGVYQIGKLDRILIRLRNPQTGEIVGLKQAMNRLHTPAMYKAWNDSAMPEFSGAIASMQFSQNAQLMPQTIHVFELGMYVAFRFGKLIENKGLEIDLHHDSISAAEMDRVIERERKAAERDDS